VARVDLAILQEIVRGVREKRQVPERVTVAKRAYQITYLEDHKQRIEEALRRYDQDRLGMLFGQLASKVKYQVIRQLPTRSSKTTPRRAVRGRAASAGTAAKARKKAPKRKRSARTR
jgi:hypothetical protein